MTQQFGSLRFIIENGIKNVQELFAKAYIREQEG